MFVADSTAKLRFGAIQTTQYHIVLLPLCASTVPPPHGRWTTIQPAA